MPQVKPSLLPLASLRALLRRLTCTLVARISGGIKGTEEKRTLDWGWRDHEDGIFGKLKGRSRWIKLSDLSAGEGTMETDIDFLTKGWEGGLSEYVYLLCFVPHIPSG